jgi:hypothetical protein
MKYTGGGIRDHILKMSNRNGKLAEMGMVLPTEFVIHLIFKSLLLSFLLLRSTTTPYQISGTCIS